MKLHENEVLFKNYIDLVNQNEGIDVSIVLKDYFVVKVLKLLYEINDELVFVGGTSLSKGYDIIKRFSEDIDIVATASSKKQKRKITSDIINTLKINWKGVIEENNRKSSDFKVTYLNYNTDYISEMDQRVKLELMTFTDPFPIEEKQITTYIYKYLDDSEINKYNMFPINVKTQKPVRTFFEKVILEKELYKEFLNGISTADSLETQEKRARDFYDIHKIWQYYSKVIPLNRVEIIHIINSRIKNRGSRTTITTKEVYKYKLKEMFHESNIRKQLEDVDKRKLSIRDLNCDDIESSLKEIDEYIEELFMNYNI